MDNSCFRCKQQVGKLENGKWIYYTKVLNHDDINKQLYFDNLCINCENLCVCWRCVECREEMKDANIEFCIDPQHLSVFCKTCVPCLNKIREESNNDLNCNCLICREINDNHNFIPK